MPKKPRYLAKRYQRTDGRNWQSDNHLSRDLTGRPAGRVHAVVEIFRDSADTVRFPGALSGKA
jgi:hypothetical protein